MVPNDILRRYVLQHKQSMIINEVHVSVAGGHFVGKYTVRKILQEGFWWPAMHADA